MKGISIKRKLLSLMLIGLIGTMLPGLRAHAESELTDSTRESVVRQVNRFADQLRGHVTTENDSQYVYSPLSYYLTLLTLNTGLTGDQQLAVSNVLSTEKKDSLSYYQDVNNLFDVGAQSPLRTQTYLLANKQFELNASYLASVESLPLKLDSVDLRSEDTYNYYNHLIAQETEGLIDPYWSGDTVRELIRADDLQALIVNTLFFKDQWVHPFTEVGELAFQGLTQTQSVPMMHQSQTLDYLATPSYQAVKLPYQSGAYMVIVLPTQAVSDSEMLENYQEAIGRLADFQPVIVNLTVPQWKVSQTLDLKPSLTYLGLESVLEDLGPTSFFQSEEGTAINELNQRIELEVDVNGTQAAAVTEVQIGVTSLPLPSGKEVELLVNRPFVYGIFYQDVITFEGSVLNLP